MNGTDPASRATFARVPGLAEVGRAAVAVVGIPFDGGSLHRPGARFGPTAVRQASRLLRPYHPGLDVEPFTAQTVADAGDLCVPLDVEAAVGRMTDGAVALLRKCRRLVAIGGDHTVSLPVLRAVRERYGPVAMVHFDAHLDTWSSYLDTPYSHRTWCCRAIEEGLLAPNRSVHIGLRGSLDSREDVKRDTDLGFRRVQALEVAEDGAQSMAALIRDQAGGLPLYLSIDINVLDPAFAPGAGDPAAGGISTRELFAMLGQLRGAFIASADVVEVCPAYDHCEATAMVAAQTVFELLSLFALA